MPLKLAKPLRKSFHLTKTDAEFPPQDGEDSATIIEVALATQGAVEARNELFTEFKREYDGDKVTVTQRISFDDVRRKEVWLTLVGCNIVDEAGSPLFRFENGKLANENEFRIAWNRLPPVTAEEIHEKVLEMNPVWKTSGEAKS